MSVLCNSMISVMGHESSGKRCFYLFILLALFTSSERQEKDECWVFFSSGFGMIRECCWRSRKSVLIKVMHFLLMITVSLLSVFDTELIQITEKNLNTPPKLKFVWITVLLGVCTTCDIHFAHMC